MRVLHVSSLECMLYLYIARGAEVDQRDDKQTTQKI